LWYLKYLFCLTCVFKFAVQDVRNGEWFALKRQLAHDKATAESVLHEIRFMKQVGYLL